MPLSKSLIDGRDCYRSKAWTDAYECLRASDQEFPLEIDDLERLAVAAYLTGRDEDSAEIWTRAHRLSLEQGDSARAAHCAFWLGWGLFFRGESVRAGGWFARAQRVLDESGIECAIQGYLLVPDAYRGCDEDPLAAYEAYSRAIEIGKRFNDPGLVALGQLGQGETLIHQGQAPQGIPLLDEVMVAVLADEISPILVGILYCAVIGACQEIFDLARAQEWTAALTRWCESQPDLVPYRGQCLVHRAEIMQVLGAWPDALIEIERARERLSDPPGQEALGAAWYQQAEIHRLRGEFAKAEDGYRTANHWGYPPFPGLAQLRLMQGQHDAAASGIRRALGETQSRPHRSRLLGAFVEIMLADGDNSAARSAADELGSIAAEFNTPLVLAISQHATGGVLLAEDDGGRAALDVLRSAWTAWQGLDASYDGARARTLMGLAYRQLGDEDAAQMEFDASIRVFRELGAGPDLARVEALARRDHGHSIGRLTLREIEVLRLVATGKTNRAIAEELFLSDKTIARHVSNIFAKLGISSRAAATAWAFEHELH